MGVMADGACEEEAARGGAADGGSGTGYVSGVWPPWEWQPARRGGQGGERRMETIGEEMARFEAQIRAWGGLDFESDMWDGETGLFRLKFEAMCFV